MGNTPKIALNMSLIKHFMWEFGPDPTFAKIREAGVSYFELSQIDMTDQLIEDILKASEKHGVTVMATSVNYQPLFGNNAKGLDMVRDFDKIVAYNHKLGVRFIRDSLIPRSCIHSEKGFYEAAETFNAYGKRFYEEGIQLCYHNHHFEFERFGDKTGFEILVENTDPKYVQFEPDVHWIQRAGQNPIDWIRRLAGRESLVHLKDYRIRFPEGDPAPDIFTREQCIQFAELGQGNLDIPEIIKVSLECGAEYLPVEQDQTYGKDPFQCLKESVSYIKSIGYQALL